MRNIKLKIAGYNIGFEASADGPDLAVSSKFLKYISQDSGYDIHIQIHCGTFNFPEEAERVFNAPFIEEIDGIAIQKNPDFWSIWKDESNLYIRTIFPSTSALKNAVLRFSLSGREWELWIDTQLDEADPFEYPLDGLILYYLTVINNDIMIHASGVNNEGVGFLFSGVSGNGKSTIAGLWERHGAKVIHDDRLIIRKSENGYVMYNTPVYDNDVPMDSPLNRIYIIEHGTQNCLVQLIEASAVAQILSNCIQHSWGPVIVSHLLESVSEMCKIVPTYKLSFRPDRSIIEQILKQDE